MNVQKAHELFEITDTYQNKEVRGACTYISDDNLSINLVIKDTTNGDINVNGYVSREQNHINLSVGCDYPFDTSIGKYVIDVLQAILNEKQAS